MGFSIDSRDLSMITWHELEFALKHLATQVSPDVFSFLGSFLEEIIPPIPSPLVMTTAGSLALAQHYGWPYLLWLAAAGAAGKTLASWVFYVAGDKLEDVVVPKFGRFLGIRHEDIEGMGKRFNGGWRDGLILFVLRSIPVFPTVMVSIVSGIIRLNPATFLGATFLGIVARNLFYLYIGYAGAHAVTAFVRRSQHLHFKMGLVLLAVTAALAWWFFVSRRKDRNPGTL
jgi:membrane protein DedA with SNARE-associated domain